MNHYPDSEKQFLKDMNVRPLREYLVSYKGKESEDPILYPFYNELDPKYSDVPSPKIRAGDIVEVNTNKDIKFFDFVISEGTAVK